MSLWKCFGRSLDICSILVDDMETLKNDANVILSGLEIY